MSSTTLETSAPDIIDQTTIISLIAVLGLLMSSVQLSYKVLTPSTPQRFRILFVWHAFDFLIHTLLEGSFLYNVFFTYEPYDAAVLHPATVTNFLNQPSRLYGAAHGDNWATSLWMVYANADRRWGEADLTVVSLELLTVFIGGPLAAYICAGIARKDYRVAYWMVVLATGELYGGFMTFCPEWLTGNLNLDGSNFMYLWVYLVFFNMLWVVMPIYALWVSYQDITNAFQIRNGVFAAKVEMDLKKKDSEKAQ